MTRDGATGAADRLPAGRMPRVGSAELVAALHHRREGRRRALEALRGALAHLAVAIEHRGARIAMLRAALDGPAEDDGGT
jgi:hypothetical protein